MWDGKQLRALLSECSKINYTGSFQLGMILPHSCPETCSIVMTRDSHAPGEAVLGRGHGFCQTADRTQDSLPTPRTRNYLAQNVNSVEAKKPWAEVNWRLCSFLRRRQREECALGTNWKQTLRWDGLSRTIKWSHPEEEGQDFRGHENWCLHMTETILFTLPRGSVSEELGSTWLVPAVVGRSGWETRLEQRPLPTPS